MRPRGVYALTKMINEDTVNAHARETGLRTVIIRPSGIISGEAILGRWSVGYVSGILRAGQANPAGSLYMCNGTELWRELEQAAESTEQLCAVCDEEGRPWLQRPVDARDVALGCICALESPAAVSEVFNISAPRAIAFPEAARIISEITGQSVLEWKLPVRWVYDLDITKAKSWIGYNPQWGIEEMVRSALAVRRGESDGLS